MAAQCKPPGDEVLVLAPYWPLAAGIIRAVGAKAISVPFYDKEGSVAERLASYCTERTVAIYVNTPNNPTGLVLSDSIREDLAAFARRINAWILSDEVYEQLSFVEDRRPMRSVAPERCISIFSFSKAYAMAGYRCGFLLLPTPELAVSFNKSNVNSVYSTSTPAQIAAANILHNGGEWIQQTRSLYQEIGRECAQRLNLPMPQGGTFLFFDISAHLKDRSIDQFMRSCIQHGLLLAPGTSFGQGYSNYIRLCFTCVEPKITLEGIDLLQELLQ